jgi:hypothetical protein
MRPRRRVLKTGFIEFGDTAIECTVRDNSQSGAAIHVVTPLYISDRFTLYIPNEPNMPDRMAQGRADGSCVRLAVADRAG